MIQTYGLWLLGAYVLLLFGVGWYSGRRQSKEGFLIADREVGGLASALSILATKIGGGMLLVYISYVYLFGPSAVWYVGGIAVGYTVFYFFAKSFKDLADERGWYSLLDYAKDRMHPGLYKGFAATLFLSFVLLLVVQFMGAGTILSAGFSLPLNLSVVIIAAVVLIYLLIGGFRAVVSTDAIQAASFIAFLGIITYGIWSADAMAVSADGMPVSLVVALFIVGILYPFSSHDLWQRVFATRKRSLSKALVGAGVLYVLVGVLLVLLGLAILALLPNVNPDFAVMLAMQQVLSGPLQLVGLLAFFAVILSSADTMLFSTASMLVQDFLEPQNVTRVLKRAFVGLTAAATVVAVLAGSFTDVAIVYVTVLVFLGSIIFYDWVGLRMDCLRATRSFYATLVVLVAAMIATGLLESVLIIGPVGYPLFIGLQKLVGW